MVGGERFVAKEWSCATLCLLRKRAEGEERDEEKKKWWQRK
jgi:hypothetical protein